MRQYDPRRWTRHLFDVEGSLVREILGRVLASVIWSTVVVVLIHFGPDFFDEFLIPATAHSLVGTALGLLLVFRTNSSNERFWEGRKQWGGIVNECRNLARQTSVWLAVDPVLARDIISWTSLFPYTVMQRLRDSAGLGTVPRNIPEADLVNLHSSNHLPLAVARVITSRLTTARERALIDSLQLTMLDQNVQLLVDYCGACERIRATPLPFAYAVHLRRILIVYCFTLPFALISDFGWATVPTTFLISYALFGVEEIGVEIEEPFGYTKNDLPIQTYCEGIEAVLNEIYGDVSSS